MTKWLLAYLSDWRADLLAGTQEQWLKGDLELATSSEAKGRANTLTEIVELPFAAIEEFYQQLDAMNDQQQEDQDDDAK